MKENNWEKLSSHYQQMTQQNAPELCKFLNAKPFAPISNDFTVQLYSAELKQKSQIKIA